jgi:hypothetical protein
LIRAIRQTYIRDQRTRPRWFANVRDEKIVWGGGASSDKVNRGSVQRGERGLGVVGMTVREHGRWKVRVLDVCFA